MMKYLFVTLALLAILSSSTAVSASKFDGASECDLCEFIVHYAEQYISNNQTEAVVIAKLEKACLRLPGTLGGDCSNAVELYGQMIFNLLINKETPATVCSQVGLCSKAKQIKRAIGATEECEICKYVATYVDNYLEKTANVTEIEALLSQDCAFLTVSQWVNECQALVDQYTPFIINYIETNETPTKVCDEIGVCSGSSSSSASSTTEEVEGSQIYCAACNYVASIVEDELKNNKTMDEIISEVSRLCPFAKEFSKECDVMVQTYIPDLITMIDNDFTPAQVCQKLKLCPPPNTPSPKAIHIRFNNQH
ncbi:hypothetical protein CYY_008540 [Polysphondylium violaceum]|uniref:Saposin B-type domain-containing protein n=1 Tax=Polysphondylium violaceum TaxID=133409 RepID=A0A8J4UQ40_9MYCE|nr:hypothetical protein CYY_008540 [Polysphondylium violaceum]